MKKILSISVIIIVILSATTYAFTSKFNFNADMLSFSKESKKLDVTSKFNTNYKLEKKLTSNENTTEEIKNITKKTTTLLIGNPGEDEESEEEYYNRHKEYLELGLYNSFPKNKDSQSGYDETNPNYIYAIASELAVPQIFNQVEEINIQYNTFGNIKTSQKGDIVISTITLPNIMIKQENEENPMEYNTVKSNLTLTYYFLKIDNEYRLAYLYGETSEEIEEYLEEVNDLEISHGLAIAPSYDTNLREIYNFSKLDELTEQQIENAAKANLNKENVVTIDAYYNTSIVSSANGFFISDGIVATTWTFIEEALVNAQFISVSNTTENYEIEGIITANPETNIALIKLKNKNGSRVNLQNNQEINIESPVIAITSKTGTGLTIQKGIVISKDEYIKTSIPLPENNQGSILVDAINGNVIGMNTKNENTSSTSTAIDYTILQEAQEKFKNLEFETIETTTFEKLKEEYYYTKYNDETIKNNIPKNQWKKYSKIGKIEENIKLKLVKANYKDGIVSLRYENTVQDVITSMQYSSKFQKELLNQGYTEKLRSEEKSIYENEEYQIILMEEFDYLIIVMVRK